MKKEKDYTLALLGWIFLFSVLVNLPACYRSSDEPLLNHVEPKSQVVKPQSYPPTVYSLDGTAHTYETDDTVFHNGEVLLPDYVHTDTLLVIDANFINWAMKEYDAQSDGDISDILKTGTVPYHKECKQYY